MFDKNLIVYLDGQYQKLGHSEISPMTHGLHYGTGVFEGIRAYEIKAGVGIFRLKEHIERLFYSAEKLGLKISETKAEIEEVCLKLLRDNNLKSAYLRPLVFFDDSALGMKIGLNKTRVFITAFPWPKYLGEDVSVKISPYTRISEKSTICDAKISGHYVNSFLASADAQKDNFDEPLLLDHQGAIAEGPVANIFFIQGKKLITPQEGKILPGITRDTIIKLAVELNYEVEERDIFPTELKNFTGAFFTGTASEITVIKQITLENKEVIKFSLTEAVKIKNKYQEIISLESEDNNKWFTLI